MKKLLTLAVAAAALLTGVPDAGAQGRTVCVLRNRPVAINPSPRIYIAPARAYVSQYSAPVRNYGTYYSPRSFSNGYYGTAYYGNGYYNNGYYNGLPVYSGGYGRGGYSVRPNGYVGGLRNLPSIYVQIPPASGRPQISRGGSGGGRPNGGSGGNGGGRPGGGGGGHGGGGGRGGK